MVDSISYLSNVTKYLLHAKIDAYRASLVGDKDFKIQASRCQLKVYHWR